MSGSERYPTHLEHLSDPELLAEVKRAEKNAAMFVRDVEAKGDRSPEITRAFSALMKRVPKIEIERRKEARRKLGLPEGLEI